MEGHKKSYQASCAAYGVIRTITSELCTTDPRTFLYSILYSKKAAVEAYTPLTHCPTAPYLYSSYSCCIAIQLYSSSTVYILYSIPLVWPEGRSQEVRVTVI